MKMIFRAIMLGWFAMTMWYSAYAQADVKLSTNGTNGAAQSDATYYRDLASHATATSREAIDSSQRALSTVMWLVTVFSTLLALGGTALAWFGARSFRDMKSNWAAQFEALAKLEVEKAERAANRCIAELIGGNMVSLHTSAANMKSLHAEQIRLMLASTGVDGYEKATLIGDMAALMNGAVEHLETALTLVDSVSEQVLASRGGPQGKYDSTDNAPIRHLAKSRIYLTLGWCAKRQGKIELAIIHLMKALELNEQDPYILYNLGCYHAANGNIADGFRFLERSLEKLPSICAAALKDPDLASLRRADMRKFARLVGS